MSLKNWLRRNAYGNFLMRLIFAMGSACVAIGLSFLPYEMWLQAGWVLLSTMCMGFLVLRQRLNESDDERYERLFKTRFAFLQENDPEALNTIFAENIRPRVMEWFEKEYAVNLKKLEKVDALDSLAINGDAPGQLIFRTGVELGRWYEAADDKQDKSAVIANRIETFISEHESLLGDEIEDGIFYRKIELGQKVPAGIHMFSSKSRILMSLKLYNSYGKRYSVSLSTRTHLFNGNQENWESFKEFVRKTLPEFAPVNGGSGPQKLAIPFFVSSTTDEPRRSDEEFKQKLRLLAKRLDELCPRANETEDESEVDGAEG